MCIHQLVGLAAINHAAAYLWIRHSAHQLEGSNLTHDAVTHHLTSKTDVLTDVKTTPSSHSLLPCLPTGSSGILPLP